ncbi:MAG: YbaK/EbsC family protein [Acidimicrobiia bacterium]|nr:YbaK/EbsC family protein [Acidimicrobiia bacterium]
MSSSVDRVLTAAAAAGLDVEIVEFPDGTRTADDAAAAVGCKVDQIVKSMIFAAGDERKIVLALTSGANRVDGDRLADLAGVDACHRATADEVRSATGFAIGGVAPIGHLSPLPTWIDPHLLTFDTIWAAAGSPRHVFAVSAQRLVELTGATIADFTVSAEAPPS